MARALWDDAWGLWPAERPLRSGWKEQSWSRAVVLPRAPPPPLAEGLTQDGEACGAGPDGSLDGLALIHGIILQLCPQDLQVMFPRQVVPYHQVLWVTCGDSGHIKGGWGSDGRHIHNRQAQRGDP